MGPVNTRERIERVENRELASYACRAFLTRGRRSGSVGSDPHRTDFQRDRDRILYSTAFRRLKYKTQVYVVHEGDFYRTRLTHSLEVMQHARTLARALSANEDLVEAISYAHDLGHPPFGHVAEERLDEITAKWGGFNHNRHSLRVVDLLERIYPHHPGLDLCFETREGIALHQTTYDEIEPDSEFSGISQPTVEAQIVNLADELAFVTHDLDDALSGGLISQAHLMDRGMDLVTAIASDIETGTGAGQWHRLLTRHLIEALSVDAISWSRSLLSKSGASSPDDIRSLPCPVVGLSPAVKPAFERLRTFLLDEVYNHPSVLMMGRKGARIVERLFQAFMEEPGLLPRSSRGEVLDVADQARACAIVDYIASLTDRQAMSLYRAMFDPEERVLKGF